MKNKIVSKLYKNILCRRLIYFKCVNIILLKKMITKNVLLDAVLKIKMNKYLSKKLNELNKLYLFEEHNSKGVQHFCRRKAYVGLHA